jgi:hypothetical protein
VLDVGLINHQGRDAFCRREIFPFFRTACCQVPQAASLYRRQLSHYKARHRLQRLDRGLLDVDQQLKTITAGEK